jgi:hypothetical protein
MSGKLEVAALAAAVLAAAMGGWALSQQGRLSTQVALMEDEISRLEEQVETLEGRLSQVATTTTSRPEPARPTAGHDEGAAERRPDRPSPGGRGALTEDWLLIAREEVARYAAVSNLDGDTTEELELIFEGLFEDMVAVQDDVSAGALSEREAAEEVRALHQEADVEIAELIGRQGAAALRQAITARTGGK